jgi:hypothetical protein
MINSLIEMGYNLKEINKVNKYYKGIDSVEEMISRLSQENGIWQHHYNPNENTKKCDICGEDSDHLDYSTYKRKKNIESFYESINVLTKKRLDERDSICSSGKSSWGSILKEKSFVNSNIQIFSRNSDDNLGLRQKNKNNNICCLICQNKFNYKEIYNLNCDHDFCNECWYEYLKENISNGKVDLNCMSYNCQEKLNEENVKDIFNVIGQGEEISELMKKFSYFILKNQILNSKDKKFCPVKDCESYGTKLRNSSGYFPKYVICVNHHLFCFDCLKLETDHKNLSCEQLIDENFELWKIGKDIKRCPNCNYWIEKNEGCNHMTCVVCLYQWCWLCNSQYNLTHYTDTTSRCYGRQFSK